MLTSYKVSTLETKLYSGVLAWAVQRLDNDLLDNLSIRPFYFLSLPLEEEKPDTQVIYLRIRTFTKQTVHYPQDTDM